MERKNRAGNTNLEIFDIGMLVEAKGVRKFLQKRGRRAKKTKPEIEEETRRVNNFLSQNLFPRL